MNIKIKNRKGAILPIAVIIMVLFAIIGVGMLMLGQGARIYAARNVADVSARLAADAGITDSVLKMNQKLIGHIESNTEWSNSSLPGANNVFLENAYSNFGYTIVPKGTEMGDGFTATSTGRSSNRQRVVNAELRPDSRWKGILVDDTIVIKNGATFHITPDTEGTVTLRTNATGKNDVDFKNGVNLADEVGLEVIIGPGGTSETISDKDGVVSNSYTAIDSMSMPHWQAPEGYVVTEPIDNSKGDVSITTGNYEYSTLDLANNSGDLLIVGDVNMYVVGDVILQDDVKIVKPDGRLTLYLGGKLDVREGVEITNEYGDATYLEIFGTDTCKSIILKNDSEFCGVIDAPEADILVMNRGDIYGAFVGNSFTLNNSGNFYYDTRVYDPNELGYHVSFNINFWWED